MKDLRILIIGFLVGVAAVSGFTVFKTQEQSPAKVVEETSPTSTFSIEPAPSASIKGTITDRQGELLWESRVATEPAKLLDNVLIQQGERLVTGVDGSVAIDFPRVGSISLGEDSDLSFIQTLPVNFVVKQTKGIVKYEIEGDVPLSIRIRSAILIKDNGIVEVTVTEGDSLISIALLEGTATIGFNDLEYVSRVFNLREGETYEYDSDQRTAINIKNK